MDGYYFHTEEMAVGYSGKAVVENLNIHLERGKILTLIGPNGAGKSTVLKSIARQLELVAGTVWLDEASLSDISGESLSKRMSVVFTERVHSELMTCEEMVATGRYPYTGKFGILSKADIQVVREVMQLVRVDGLADEDFMKISDGQRQRVMLARALCQAPEILLLDEPTSYLDVKYKLEFLTVLQEMTRKKGLTVIMSLHELDLAERISDKVLCIGNERVERFGTPDEIFIPGYIRELFGMTAGNFDEGSGVMELERPGGTPGVFVIGGNGTGRKIFRRLQREGRSFVTGILYENDLDYPSALALAGEVIGTPAFEEVPPNLIQRAREKIDACEEVISGRDSFGSWDRANEEIFRYAYAKGKIRR